MDVVAMVMYALIAGLIIGLVVGGFSRFVWQALTPAGWHRDMPEGVNNALNNLYCIASGADIGCGDQLSREDMMKYAKGAIEAIYKDYP